MQNQKKNKLIVVIEDQIENIIDQSKPLVVHGWRNRPGNKL